MSILVFPSQLGWMAIVTAGETLQRLTFGHRSPAAARAAIAKVLGGNRADIRMIRAFQVGGGDTNRAVAKRETGNQDKVTRSGKVRMVRGVDGIVVRLQAYAAGTRDDFLDVPLDPGSVSPFQQRVLAECRRIGYGLTVTYGELAARAGSPGAARAVGSCMAGNRIPLAIPCHRVVRGDGKIGCYSAPGGTKMKCKLLWLEANK